MCRFIDLLNVRLLFLHRYMLAALTCCRPRAGSGVVRIDPLRFVATKPGLALSAVYLSMFYCIVVY